MRIAFVLMFVMLGAAWGWAQPPGVPLQDRAVPILRQMRAQKLTPQQAWENGLLKEEIFLFLLRDERLLDAVNLDAANLNATPEWKPGRESHEFVRLLLEQRRDLLEPDSGLNATARFRVALYLVSRNDPQGAVMLRATLATLPENDAKRARMTLAAMRATNMPLQQAWGEGLLNEEVLLSAVNADDILDPGRGLWNPARESRDFSLFLIERFPDLLEPEAALSESGRIRVGLTLLSNRDARGEAMLNRMIDDFPRQNPDLAKLGAILYGLANFYRSQGQHQKSIETSLRIKEFTQKPSTLANFVLGAARTTYALGDKAGAQKLYAEVIGYGYGWATGHALSDLAGYLFAEGNLKEGRAVLKQPIEGHNGDQFRVVLNERLAQSYFSTGEWEQARYYAQATIDQYNSLANPIKHHGLEYSVSSAQSLLEQIDRNQKRP